MQYKVLISDRSFNVIDQIENEIQGLKWNYGRIGGCGSFSFTMPIRFAQDNNIGLNFNIKIYRRNPSTSNYDLWYQGRIESKDYKVDGDREVISVKGSGYQSQLNDIYVDRNYASQEISVIVKDILDNDIVPNTDITYDVADIAATSFTPDSIKLNTNAMDAFQSLADITGTREWGVDRNRKFFFKARGSTVNFKYPLGNKVSVFEGDNTSKDIVNRVIVQGGDVAGTPFTATYNDTTSQLKWKRRDKTYQNSSITTSSVAQQFANSIFSEFSEVVRRGRVELLDERLIENTTPIGLFRLLPKSFTYSTRKFKTGVYGGAVDYQINQIDYSIDDQGVLSISMQVGQLRPNVAENISQLEYKLEQLRSSNL